MPRPTSIADGVGFAESPVATRVKRPAPSKFNPVIWGESQQSVWRRGGVPEERVGWVSNPKKTRMAWVSGVLCAFAFASLFATAIPERIRAVPCMLGVCIALASFAASTSWSDARIGGVRFLRVAPLRRVKEAATVARRAEHGRAAAELIAARHAHRLTLKWSARARDVVASPQGMRLMTLAQMTMYLAMVISPIAYALPQYRWAMWWGLPVMLAAMGAMFFFSYRARVSRRVDERQRAGKCPDCGYDVSGLGDDPALDGLVPGCGPASCPECGVKYPLVPPPTPREVAEGNRPQIVR